MAAIFKNQSKLRIQLTTSVDITGATVKQIKYIKPSGTTGEWDATSSDDENGVIYYDIIDDELDENGRWTLYAYITFSDGRSAPGEKVYMQVYQPGSA